MSARRRRKKPPRALRPRRKAILVGFTPEEREELHEESKRTGLTMSALMAFAWTLARPKLRAMKSHRAILDRIDFVSGQGARR